MPNNFSKTKLVIISMFFFLIFISSFDLALAAEMKLQFLPSSINQGSPVTFVSWFYGFALGLVGIAVFGVIIYGAIIYTVSAGNASAQADAREWITSAIWGLVLLLAAYLILWTINKDIVNLGKIQGFLKKEVTPVDTTPAEGEVTPVDTTPAEGDGTCGDGVETCPDYGGGGGGQKIDDGGAVVGEGSLSEKDARSRLSDNNIQTKDSCPAGQTKDCVNFNGMKEKTMAEIVVFSKQAGSQNVFISGGTEGAHSDGVYSHSNGYKFDVRMNDAVTKYIEGNYTRIDDRIEKDGSKTPQYQSSDGAIYAKESNRNHWDVLVK
ncbi:hypothetical protein HZB06_02250 [Candidatus Wolfebacteria bacterium]|nr:hypothetical protein [Candidatus Wolfebacteria bacterium]